MSVIPFAYGICHVTILRFYYRLSCTQPPPKTDVRRPAEDAPPHGGFRQLQCVLLHLLPRLVLLLMPKFGQILHPSFTDVDTSLAVFYTLLDISSAIFKLTDSNMASSCIQSAYLTVICLPLSSCHSASIYTACFPYVFAGNFLRPSSASTFCLTAAILKVWWCWHWPWCPSYTWLSNNSSAIFPLVPTWDLPHRLASSVWNYNFFYYHQATRTFCFAFNPAWFVFKWMNAV